MHRIVRTLALGAMFAAFAVGSAAQTPSPHAIEIPRWFAETFLDVREDIADARREGRRLMIYYGQDGCPYCKLLMQTTFTETRLVDKIRRGFVPIALNLWGDRDVTWIDGRVLTEKELGRQLKVQFTPTLLFFNEQGEVIVRLHGYQPPHRMEAALDYVGQRLESKQTFESYLERSSKEAASATLRDEAFFIRAPYDLSRPGAKPLVVIFERTHCTSCDELHREGFARPEIVKALQRFTVVRFDSSSQTELTTPDGRRTTASAWARDLRVNVAPTLVFFDRDAEVFRVDAYVRPFHLASALDYVETRAYRTEPSFQRYVQARADGIRSRGEQVDLWK